VSFIGAQKTLQWSPGPDPEDAQAILMSLFSLEKKFHAGLLIRSQGLGQSVGFRQNLGQR
jgi:hypothetical protein